MHWPDDHPVRTDPRLAEWQADADAVCAGGRAVELLRYVPGRRATTLVETSDGPAVLKLFASPHAGGTDRRLRLLRPATGSLVPRPLGAGPAGHANLLEYIPGRSLREFSGTDFVVACEEVGRRLARLHGSHVLLDRNWTAWSEIHHLTRGFTSGGGPWWPPAPDTLVPSHRDLHPAQVVVASGAVRLIDLDNAAMAPAGLDVGNFLAYLARTALSHERPTAEAEAAAGAFLCGYGRTPQDLPWWRRIALVRIACSLEERHGRPALAARLRELAG